MRLTALVHPDSLSICCNPFPQGSGRFVSLDCSIQDYHRRVVLCLPTTLSPIRPSYKHICFNPRKLLKRDSRKLSSFQSTVSEQRDPLEHGLLDIFNHAIQSRCSFGQSDVPVRNHHQSKGILLNPGSNADSNGGNSDDQYFDTCIWDISVSYDIPVKSRALMDTERLAKLSRPTPSRVQGVSLDSLVMQQSKTYPGISDFVQKDRSACAQIDDKRQIIRDRETAMATTHTFSHPGALVITLS